MKTYRIYLRSGTVTYVAADDVYVNGSGWLQLSVKELPDKNGDVSYRVTAQFAPQMWEGYKEESEDAQT